MLKAVFLILCLILNSARSFAAKRPAPAQPKACDQELQPLPKIEPIILRPLDRPLERISADEKYQFEMKYDGFRGLAYLEKDRCRFISRQGKSLSQFQALCESISKKLGVENAIFDGEVIAPDESDRPIFSKLLKREGPYRFVAFDLLWLDGEDLRSLPLEERRERLVKLLPKSSPLIEPSLAVVGDGLKMFKLMVEHDLEGIVVKRLSDPYKRSTRWYKYKNKDYSQAKGRARFF